MGVNGYEMLEKLTGITKEEQMKIMEDIRNNNKLLESCNLHDFSIEVPQKHTILSKWKCSNCGGIVDSTQKQWYEKGLNHANQKGGYNL